MLRPRCGRGAGSAWDRRRGERKESASFCQLGREWRGGCQSLGDLWGRRGSARRRRVGRRPPSCLENKERGAGPAGAASVPPRRGLPPAASPGGCRKHFPNSSLGGRNPLLFCSQEGEKWAEVPAAMLLPVSSACRVPATVHPSPSRIFPDALCAGVLKEWTVKKTQQPFS